MSQREIDGRPGDRIKPTQSEPEYVKRAVPVRSPVHPNDCGLVIDMVVCTRCGCYVWDLQAHEDYHRP